MKPISITAPVFPNSKFSPDNLLFKINEDNLTIQNKTSNKVCQIGIDCVAGFTINYTGKNPIYHNSLFLSRLAEFDENFFSYYYITKDEFLISIKDLPSINRWSTVPEIKLDNFNIGEHKQFFIAVDNKNKTTYTNISRIKGFTYFYENKIYIYEFDEYHGYFLKEVQENHNNFSTIKNYSTQLVFYGLNLSVGDIREFNSLLQKQIKNAKGMYSLHLARFANLIKSIVSKMK